MKKHNAKTSPRFSGIGDIRPEDFYWLIGILEGEGCFGITPARRYKNSVYRYPKIALQMTDEAGVYRGLGGLFFNHETVNHSEGEYVRDGVTTNGVESVFAVMKRGRIL